MTHPLPQLGPVKGHVRSAAQHVEKEFGISNIGGFATGGHMPDSDHYSGLAIDVMTSDKALGDRVNRWALSSEIASFYGVKYTIWYRMYYQPDGYKKSYSGSSPHTDHVHISFNNKPGIGGSLGASGSIADSGSSIIGFLEESGLRVAMFIGGGILVLAAVYQINQKGMLK